MSDIDDLTKKVLLFRDERNWKQFHNPKDLAISLVLEATELLEHFQWKNPEEMTEYVAKNKPVIGEEIADVLYWILLISNDLDIDLSAALVQKLKINAEKYPVELSKGKHTKYNKL
jgi:NTP pyrophosphatase (non-canonical NTP hydrolase)